MLSNLYNGQLLPPANEVWGKVIFLHVSVILSTGGGVASQHASRVTWPGGLLAGERLVCMQGEGCLHPGVRGLYLAGGGGSASVGKGSASRGKEGLPTEGVGSPWQN